MTSLKQVQTPEQTIQEVEKKIKKAKKLEKVCLIGVASGIGVLATGSFIEEEMMLEMLGMGITLTSTVKGLSTVFKKGNYESQINQEYLKYLKQDTRDTRNPSTYQNESETKSDEGDSYKTK